MTKKTNRFEFDVYFDAKNGGWFWVMYQNDIEAKKSEPFATEKDADKALADFQLSLIKQAKKE